MNRRTKILKDIPEHIYKLIFNALYKQLYVSIILKLNYNIEGRKYLIRPSIIRLKTTVHK